MSLIKWRKREITTVICSMFLVIVNTLIFHLVWEKYYSPLYYSRFFSIGKYAATAMCFWLYIYLGRLYGAFWLKISRITEIIYANIVTNVITGGILYIVAWIFIRHLPNIFPMMLIICLWTITACLWIKPAIMVMNHYCAVERMVIIYDSSANYHNGKTILSRVSWRFKVVGEICADQTVASIMEQLNLLHAEAVMLCDIPVAIKNELVKHCIIENIATYVQPNAGDYLINSAKSVQIANMPFLFCQRASSSGLYTFFKRIMDILLGAIGLLISSPIMLVITILIKIYDQGPVFVKEQRITLNKQIFDIYKFRTTKVNVNVKDTTYKSLYTDDRLTPVGRFLRRFRLNELPKLVNVLKGDLAIVGPRAEEPEEALLHEKEMPEYALKFQVKAGLTGYVQIFGRYSTSMADRLQMDLMYISQQNLVWDMKMILATIKVIFLPEGMNLILDGRVFTEEEENNCGQTNT